MIKKIIISLLGIVLAGQSAAGTMGPTCTAENVTVPCTINAWDVSIDALYLEPNYTGQRSYTVSQLPFPSTLALPYTIDQRFGWGYRLAGSYHYAAANDIKLSWMHYDVDGRTQGTYIEDVGLGPLPYTVKPSTKFDQLNLILGQLLEFGPFKNSHFYGGAQYASLRSGVFKNYGTTAVLRSVGISGSRSNSDIDFNGFGPTLGVDFNYGLFRGISLTANTASSILYGSSRSSVSLSALPQDAVLFTSIASTKKIVTSLEGKLGLAYSYVLDQGALNISGGYQVMNYFNTGGISTVNFSLYGPYLGLNWLSNV